jgi:predicted dehydrogenase
MNKNFNKKIRVGVIGCGSVAESYLPLLLASPFALIVSVCDIKAERAKQKASDFQVANWYINVEDMLDGVPFDLFVNLTDMQEHGRLNRMAINAGKYVWSEKPISNSYDEGCELLNLALKNGLRIWGAPVVVNSPQFAFMARQVNEGSLGKIASVSSHYGHCGPEWSAFFYEEFGGSLPDLGVYNIATLTGLFGPVKSVVSLLNIITPDRDTGDKGLVRVVAEDNAQVLCEHHSGVLSHIQCGFNFFNPYGHGGIYEKSTISVWGSKGNMHLIGYDWKPVLVEMATEDHPETRCFSTDRGSYVWPEGASVICECMVKGKEPLFQIEHTLHVLEIIEAARKSQETGQRIALKSTFNWPVVK